MEPGENEIEETANRLAIEQSLNLANQQINQLLEEGRQYGRPSWLKYGFLFAVAAVMDIVAAAELTGIGIILSKIVALIGNGLIFSILFMTNGKIKRAHQYGESLEAAVASFSTQIARADRLALKGAKVLGKVPGLSGASRGARLARLKIKKLARKNPYTKMLIGGGIKMVPLLAVLDLMVFWVYMNYRDEKQAYQEAREAALEAAGAIEQVQVA